MSSLTCGELIFLDRLRTVSEHVSVTIIIPASACVLRSDCSSATLQAVVKAEFGGGVQSFLVSCVLSCYQTSLELSTIDPVSLKSLYLIGASG